MPTSNPPQIACPVDVTVAGVAAGSQVVTYDAPKVTDGAAPVTTTCSPESGASFALGSTTVNCQAADARARKATCSFNVTLKGMSIPIRKLDAIGDSFTEGQNGEPGFVDLPNAYPSKLQMTLDAVYPGQGVTTTNYGAFGSGQSITVIDQNVIKFVTADKPDAMLLEGGYNDLLNDCGTGPTTTTVCRNAVQRVQLGYRDCIRHAKESPRNVRYVFAATLTPPGPLQPGAQRDRRISNDAIVQANASIRPVIGAEGAVLVDLYPLFVGHEAEYVDTDGLHLRPAGYQVMADAFFAAIQHTIPQTPLFGFRFP